MVNFFKKFMGDSTRGKPCQECGHSETSHHLKIIESELDTKPYNSPTIRARCKECDCQLFKGK